VFSVVIPAFNARRTLHRAVMSVLHQTVGDFELVVVDDGSTDGTCDVVPDDPRVSVVTQENRGEGAARNAGIAAARHAWVAFLDADDAWHPDHLAELQRIRWKVPDAALIATRSTYSGRRGRRGGRVGEIPYFEQAWALSASSTALRRDAALALGGFGDEPLGCDTEMWVRLALRHPVAASSRVTVRRFHVGGATHQGRERWRGVREAADLSPGVRTALAADPPPPGLDRFVDLYVGYALATSWQLGDVSTMRSLRGIYRARPPLADRVLLAGGRLRIPLVRILRRPLGRVSVLLAAAARESSRAGPGRP
jgi:glycosyltransferase involved in cell wall biosynthesis